MKTYCKVVALAALALTLAFASTTRTQESVAGKWKAQFDSQIGVQKYTFDFKVDGNKLTGTATGENRTGANTVTITKGESATNETSFVEPLKFQDNEIRIEYSGKVSGDEIKFHLKVGDFAEEDLVAIPVKESDEKFGAETDTNLPPHKPNN